jgi:hypothetical protein
MQRVVDPCVGECGATPHKRHTRTRTGGTGLYEAGRESSQYTHYNKIDNTGTTYIVHKLFCEIILFFFHTVLLKVTWVCWCLLVMEYLRCHVHREPRLTSEI